MRFFGGVVELVVRGVVGCVWWLVVGEWEYVGKV